MLEARELLSTVAVPARPAAEVSALAKVAKGEHITGWFAGPGVWTPLAKYRGTNTLTASGESIPLGAVTFQASVAYKAAVREWGDHRIQSFERNRDSHGFERRKAQPSLHRHVIRERHGVRSCLDRKRRRRDGSVLEGQRNIPRLGNLQHRDGCAPDPIDHADAHAQVMVWGPRSWRGGEDAHWRSLRAFFSRVSTSVQREGRACCSS